MASEKRNDFDYLKISKINNNIYLGSFEHPYSVCRKYSVLPGSKDAEKYSNFLDMDTKEFEDLKFDVIINCAKEIEYPPQDKYIIEHFPLVDNQYASLLDYIDGANDTIHKHLKNNKKIYLHCNKGISRSPAILIYYLMSHKKFTYERALSLITKIRPIVEINSEFERELLTIEAD